MNLITPRLSSNTFGKAFARCTLRISTTIRYNSTLPTKMNGHTERPSIAILGAGPAGLTLGRLLDLNKIPYTIFERDATADANSQWGGSL
jgi:ribulose 1,5-bisphosphate synthetase/thiazole synthase